MSLFFGIGVYGICTLMFLFDIHRITKIFNIKTHLYILLIISLFLGVICFYTIWYQGENKILTILGTICSWIFVASFIIMILLLIELLISFWYKIDPWIITGMIILIFGIGIFFSLKTKIINLDITTDKINQDTKILLVSDIHVDYVISEFHLKKLIKIIEQEKPDFVLIAGDLLNRPHSGYINAYKILKEMSNKVPIYAIEGNHDLMGNTEIINKIPNVSGIKLLKNEMIEEKGINIAGIIDKSIWKNQNLNKILKETFTTKENDKFTILMTHQPIALNKLEGYPIDLEVAGHTHNGQIYGFRELVKVMNDYGYGKYEESGKIAFITQGIGTRGLPLRLGTQSEVVIINLKKKK